MNDPVTLVVSIDTEEDNWDPVEDGITVDNIRELPRLHRFLEQLGLRATYFTTFQVAAVPWAAGILRDLVASGRAEVGAHLHPWNTPPLGLPLVPRNTMMVNLPVRLQVAKIKELTSLLTTAVGKRPHAFRAGRWGFGRTTAAALLECGYEVDSSVTPFKSWSADGGPSHVGAPIGVYRLDGQGDTRVPAADGRLIEVPASWGYAGRAWTVIGSIHRLVDRPGLRRLPFTWLATRLHIVNQVVLSPEIESVEQMLRLTARLLQQGVSHLHLTWHSPTLRPGLSPFAKTAADVQRFYANIAAYVEGLQKLRSVRFATVSEAAARLSPPPAPRNEPPPGKRSLVVVSYHFPPDPAIGGMRWAGLTKYLGRLGWRSRVITAAPVGTNGSPPGVTIESHAKRHTLNDLYLRLRHGNRQGGAVSGSGSTGTGTASTRKVNRLVSQLRLEGSVLLSLPDEGRGWIGSAARATRRAIKMAHPVAVVSSGPPHSAHLAAWLATRFTSVLWYVDMRDPWAGPLTDAWRETPGYRSRVARWVIKNCERLVLRSATGVICNTREFASAMMDRYPNVRIDWIPNAVDRDLLPRPAGESPFPGLALTHVGTIYGGRDLGPILRALREFLTQYPTAASEGTRLRIAGHVDEPYREAILRQAAALELDPHVELLGMLPRSEALQLVMRSGLAIVLAQHQEFQVPAKLYELVAMGIPTLVIGGEGSATAAEAERLGAARREAEDIPGIVSLLERAWRGELTLAATAHGKSDYSQLAPDVSALLGHTSS